MMSIINPEILLTLYFRLVRIFRITQRKQKPGQCTWFQHFHATKHSTRYIKQTRHCKATSWQKKNLFIHEHVDTNKNQPIMETKTQLVAYYAIITTNLLMCQVQK